MTDGPKTIRAECTPCGASLELVRAGTQTATIKNLEAFVAQHEHCRSRGDVVIRSEGGE